MSLNLSYASDLISKASNGVLNENSLGVKKLSDEEMKQVKGGVEFYRFMKNDIYGNQSGRIDYRTGIILNYSVSYAVVLSDYEQKNQTINGYGPGTGRTNYMVFNNFADTSRGEFPVVTVAYNASSQTVSFTFGTLNWNSSIHRRINDPLADAIIRIHKNELFYQMQQDARRFR